MFLDGTENKCASCSREELPARIALNGLVAEKHFARHKSFICCHCKDEIPQWTYYYSVIAGSGLSAIKFADRVHQECAMAFLHWNYGQGETKRC